MYMSKQRRTHFELKAAMREIQISQAELARILKVTQVSVWRWVNGVCVIPSYLWVVLALLAGQKPAHLRRGAVLEWIIEEEDVFAEGQNFRDLVKKYHPDVTGRDTTAEMAVINSFKNFR